MNLELGFAVVAVLVGVSALLAMLLRLTSAPPRRYHGPQPPRHAV